jgi:hypothetical protein
LHSDCHQTHNYIAILISPIGVKAGGDIGDTARDSIRQLARTVDISYNGVV